MKRILAAALAAALAAGCDSTPTSSRSSRGTGSADTAGIDRRQADRDMREMVDAMARFSKDDPREWQAALAEIEGLPSQAAIPDWVRESLRDASSRDERRAAAARDRLGRAGQTGIVLRRLDSPRIEDWEVARETCLAMGEDSTFALVQALVRKFQLPFAGDWERARGQLVLIGPPAVPILGAYIEGSSGAELKEQCALALGYMRETADAELSRLAASGDEAVRRAAAVGLGRSATPAAISVLARRVRSDPSWRTRAEAVMALGKTRLPETADAVAAALRDEDPFVRRKAAEGLGAYSCTAAIVALRDAANDPDNEVSAIAASSYDRVLRTLILMLRARDPGIRAAAAQSLRAGTGQRLGSDPRAWETWLRGRSDR